MDDQGAFSGDARARCAELLKQLADPTSDVRDRRAYRDQMVAINLPLVESCVRRYLHRGEPYDDLMQVGTIGLLKAIDRFNCDLGVEFSTYATPTILGELKRHFRDRGWVIRVPRRLQEMRSSIVAARSELTQRLGRSPTAPEIAEHVGVSVQDVFEGIESANAYSTVSLDATQTESGYGTLADSLGVIDGSLEHIELRESLKPLIAELPERERKVLVLRFFHGMTQAQIAEEIDVSQMHVSRLLSRTIAALRESLEAV